MSTVQDIIAASEGTEKLLWSCPDNPYESIYIHAKIENGLLTVTDNECEYGPDGGWSYRTITFDGDNTVKAISALMERDPDPFRALKRMLSYKDRTRVFLDLCDSRGIRYTNTLSF